MRPNPESRLGMGTLLARNWWTLALRGAIAILFGIAVFVLPGISLALLVALFGAFAIIGGVFALIAALRGRGAGPQMWILLLQGLIGIFIGVFVFLEPVRAGVILVYLIAAWAIISGVFEILAAIALRKEIQNEWLLAAAGVASLLFGLLLAVRPVAGALAILWVIGAYAISFGIILLVLAFRLRNWNKQEPPTLL